mmetsp:Transcript_29589/g.70300  ORF Transcript_29589/g.70300 Transcript_29589/m.70300 type:complete len:149 (+) Transcript_29589:83-529(+)
MNSQISGFGPFCNYHTSRGELRGFFRGGLPSGINNSSSSSADCSIYFMGLHGHAALARLCSSLSQRPLANAMATSSSENFANFSISSIHAGFFSVSGITHGLSAAFPFPEPFGSSPFPPEPLRIEILIVFTDWPSPYANTIDEYGFKF